MSVEENISQELIKRFMYLENKVRIARPRRLFCDIDLPNFSEVFDYLVKSLGFNHLVSITGFDELDKLGFMYHLAQNNGIVFNLKTTVNKDKPVIKTVTPYFAGAEIYERELVDLFGAQVEGLQLDNRYPLTDDWPKDQFPLRKDWKPNT